MTEESQGGPAGAEPGGARGLVEELVEAGLLDRVMSGRGGRGAGADR